MAGVTDVGWEALTYDELNDSNADSAKEAWGESFPTTPDSTFGELSSIISAALKDAWDLGQSVTDTQNRDTAEGIYLDYLAAIVGLTRQTAYGATGDVLFTGDVGTIIVSSTACKDLSSNVVLTDESETLNRASCYESTFSILSLQDSTDYTLVVEGITNTVNSGVGADEGSILDALKVSLDLNNTTTNTVDSDELTLTITYPSKNNELTTTNTSNISLDSVGALVSCTSSSTGDISIYADTVTTLVTPNVGISTVNNPSDFEDGIELETDAELRLRMAEREQSTGTATKPSIEASLSEVSGVSSVLILVNDTLTDNETTGIPAKQFETFISGGDEDDIAEVLWETKPVMGQTHGDIEKTIIDDNGDTQSVFFSRPSTEYAWITVTYSINDEETFPSDGESDMKTAVTDYGNNMDQGEDFEPTKFYSPLYEVEGVYISSIEIATTEEETDTPTYQSTRISVDDTTTLEFSEDRVTVTT